MQKEQSDGFAGVVVAYAVTAVAVVVAGFVCLAVVKWAWQVVFG